MGVFDKLGELAKEGMAQLQERGIARIVSKPVTELSDAELEDELLRRRRERAAKRGLAAHDVSHEPTATKGPRSPQEQQLVQYFANLELKPGATTEDVRRAYRDLMRKYHPDKHIGDPERHKASTELAQSLTRAYQALMTHLGSK